MRLPKQVSRILKNGDISLASWVTILNYFQEKQSHLSRTQKIRFYNKSEMMREYWNRERHHTETVYRWDGTSMEVDMTSPSLDIEIEDIRPDNLYTDKTIMRYVGSDNGKG
jgi:hypothetical protein